MLTTLSLDQVEILKMPDMNFPVAKALTNFEDTIHCLYT